MGVKQVNGLKQKEHLYSIIAKESKHGVAEQGSVRTRVGARVTGKRPTLLMEKSRVLSFNTQGSSSFSIQKSYSFSNRK